MKHIGTVGDVVQSSSVSSLFWLFWVLCHQFVMSLIVIIYFLFLFCFLLAEGYVEISKTCSSNRVRLRQIWTSYSPLKTEHPFHPGSIVNSTTKLYISTKLVLDKQWKRTQWQKATKQA
jgi:hypothetical protein